MKKLLLSSLCLTAVLVAAAAPVTKEQAREKAENFLAGRCLTAFSGAKAPRLVASPSNRQQHFYVFNAEDERGFVIVSGDDCAPDILGYSDKGHLDLGNLPPDAKWWLEGYEQQIAMLDRLPAAAQQATTSTERQRVEPLVMTEWAQGQPFNILCPTENGQPCLTGCVATAMAQIMYYHHAPKSQIDGVNPYPIFDGYNIIGMREALGPITFDWANMKLNYSNGYNESEMLAVAQLMQYCGWSVMMEYGTDVSLSGTENIALRLKDTFGFDEGISYKERAEYSDSDWEELIYNELAARRPVAYGGSDAFGGGGHAFICDGYDGDGLFHINWGWAGDANGFYRLSVLHPAGYSYQFSKEQGAVIGIQSSDMAPGAVIKADDMEREYGDSNPAPTFSVGTMTIPVGEPALAISATETSPVGDYPIVAGRGTITESDLRLIDGKLTVSRAPLTVTARDYTIMQGDPLPDFEADFTGFKNGEDKSVLTAQPKFNYSFTTNSAPGTYDLTPYGASAQNYSFTYVPGKVTIVKAPSYELTMVGDPQVEAGASSTMTFTVENTGDKDYDKGFNVYFDTFDHGVIGTYDEQKDMGRITVNQTVAAGSQAVVQFSFEGAPLGVECAFFIRYIDKDGDESRLGKNDYYFIWQDLSVAVKADDKSREYGELNPELTYTVTSQHKPAGKPALTCEATKASPVGDYPITIARGTITEEELTLTNGTLTVTKATLTVTAKDYTIMQGDPLPDFEADFTGFKNGEDKSVLTVQPIITTTATSESQPGTYDIIVSGADAQNYAMSYVAGTLTITERPTTFNLVLNGRLDCIVHTETGKLEVRASVKNNTSDDYTDGFDFYLKKKDGQEYVQTDYQHHTTTAPRNSGRIAKTTFEGLEWNKEYSVELYYTDFIDGEHRQVLLGTANLVFANTIVITARSYTISQGDPLPEFAFTAEGDRLVGTPHIRCEATSLSPIGTYTISVERGTVENLLAEFVGGTLTIEPAEADLAVQANVNNADEWTESEIYGWIAQVTGNEAQLQAELTNNAKLAYDDDAFVRIYKIHSGTYGYLDKEHREHLRIEPGATGTMAFTFTGEMGAVYFFNIYYLSKGEEKRIGSWWFTFNAENGIASLVAASPSAEVRVLSIDGKLLRVVNAAELQRTLASLPKGIYIVNGKKVRN